jgi:hypothetical protein
VIRVAAGIAVLGLVLAVALALWADSRGAPWWADLLVACAPLLLLTVPAGLLAWTTRRYGDPHDVTCRYR